MTGFPTFDSVAAVLLTGLLAFWAGSWWRGRRPQAPDQGADRPELVLRNTSLWHQRAQGQAQQHQGPEPPTDKERA